MQKRRSPKVLRTIRGESENDHIGWRLHNAECRSTHRSIVLRATRDYVFSSVPYVGRVRLLSVELGRARRLVRQVTYNRYLGVGAQFSCHLRSVVLFFLRQVRHENAYACIVVLV